MAENKFKQICFNELTLQPLCANETEIHKRITRYASTLKKAQNSLGTKVVRYADDLANIQLSEDTSLRDFCAKYKHEAGVIAILSSATMPQVNPDDTEKYETYANVHATVVVDGQEKPSDGLTAAYVYDVPSIGLLSSVFWENVIHDVHVISDEEVVSVNWPCLTVPEHMEDETFNQWIQEHTETDLELSALSYEEKTKSLDYNLREDHGKDVLKDHAKRLCRSEFVEGILCSLPFQPRRGSYISKITNDGLIDIVLFWDDRGLSMRVKTTGRNMQETAAIAKILKEKYSK